ncbi:MAG: histidinol dehydrogenase [Balneolaceae bacterium]|nr:histidinol dehydrogenase [Balneolaceae bacterium]
MKKYLYNQLSEEEVQQLCKRPKMDFKAIFETVQPIINAVRDQGDEAVIRFTKKFDQLTPDPLIVNPADKKVELEADVKEAIDTAFRNIYRFHKAQLPMPLEVETMPGVVCKRVARPIEKVGLYVPGGTAMLPSTLMMLGIPALLAGCNQIVIATPPNSDNSIPDEIIYIAQKIGAKAILKAGGAQAIAAMAWGTESVPKADKILGPGNQYVTAAKMMLQNSEAQIAIDMPAGPSEVLIIADETAEPAFVAADLLSQAEHGADSQVVLAATPTFNWEKLEKALNSQLNALPRKEIAEKALENSFSVEVEELSTAFEFSNKYAPEHLIVQCKDAENWQSTIQNAGSVFLGPWTPESVGDYASGTNHTLPTYGYAKMYSGVSLDSFYKYITVQQLSEEGIQNVGPVVETLAALEKLDGHKNAVSVRLEKLKDT